MSRLLRRLVLAASLLAGATGMRSADVVNAVSLALAATPEHPRNSEGAFATLKSGRIIFCFSQFSGGDEDSSPCRIVQIESDDDGVTWSQPHVLFTPEPGTTEMSTSLLQLASGKLALFSLIKHGTRDCRPYLRLSSDDGATWSAPRSLITAPGYFVLNNDRILQTREGRLIMPLAYHRVLRPVDDTPEPCDLRAIALWYYSDDDGATWREAATWWTLPAVTQTGLQEPGVVELADGSLFSWVRTDQGSQFGFRSRDRGDTWTAPQPTTLRSPASPASIKRLPGSEQLLAVYNDYTGQFPFAVGTRTYSGRTPLVAAVSSDGGNTWQNRKLLENDPQRDYCYTAIHFTRAHVLFAYMSISRDPAKPSELVIRRTNRAWLTAPDDALVVRARSVLHDVMNQEQSWIKIHAAEALLAGGEAVAIRDQFLALVPQVDTLPYRIGVWRVLANTSPTAAERARCVAAVEQVFLNPASTDRSQALETLCKLRVPVTGAALEEVRRLARDEAAPLRPLALWSLRLAKEPGAIEQITALLRSPSDTHRSVGAYTLRQLRETDPAALRALADAADVEKPGTRAYAYLHSAAFALNADPARRAGWRQVLEQVLASGSMEARFEACNGLVGQAHLADLPKYAPLLDDPGNDTRVGAALTIVSVHVRE